MEHTAYVEWQDFLAASSDPLLIVFLVIAPAILPWIRKYGIRSVLNTPCGLCGDCATFIRDGVKVLGVHSSERANTLENHVQGDLCVWKPTGEWDAAYVNCFFC